MTTTRNQTRPPFTTFVRYVALGGGSMALNIAIVALLSESAKASPALAGALGYGAIFACNFFVARRYVFHSNSAVLPEVTRYAVVQLTSRAAEYGAYLALVYVAHMPYIWAIVLVGLCFFIAKFGIYRFLVFKPDNAKAHAKSR